MFMFKDASVTEMRLAFTEKIGVKVKISVETFEL